MNHYKIEFLDKYGIDGVHYHRDKEINNLISAHSIAGDGLQKALYISRTLKVPTPEQTQKMLESPNIHMRKFGVIHANNDDQIVKALDHPHAEEIHRIALDSDHIRQPSIDKIFDNAVSKDNATTQVYVLTHPKNANAIDHYNKMDVSTQRHVALNPLIADKLPSALIRHIHKNSNISGDAIQRMQHAPDDVRNAIIDKEGIGEHPDIAYRYSKSKEIKNKIVNLSRGTPKENLVDQAVLFHHDSDTNHILNALKNPNVSNSVKRFGEDTLLRRGYYDKELGISESLDSKEVKTELPHDSMLHQMGLMSASMVGGSNFSMHQIGNSGYLVQFDKDGATEVHHLDENLSGGRLKGSMAPSMKMVGTFKDHIQNLLDSGKKVRISTHKELGDGFRKITERLIARHPEYKMSSPQDAEHELTGDKLTTWELSK